jgi:hypothetical protein
MFFVVFVYYQIYTSAQDIASYTAQYSNDGISYTSIQTAFLQKQQNVYAVPTGNPIEANFATSVNARYLRLIVNSTHVANSYACILELLPIVCTTPALPTISCSNSNLLNSGTNATGSAPKTLNTFDNNWKVAYVKGAAGVNNTTVANRTFLPAWVAGNKAPGAWINSPYANSEWLTYTATSYDVNSNGPGDGSSLNTYFYKYRFNIADAYALAAFKLKIDFYVDNTVNNIYINGTGYAATLGLPAGSFLAGSQVSATLNNGWQLGANELLIQTSSAPGAAGFLIQNITGCLGVDFGDAPATYLTTKAANGPGHIVETNASGIVTLKLGAGIDVEADGVISANADSDDTTGTVDDENGINTVFPAIPQGPNPVVTNYTVSLSLSNTTGSPANLCGWIDWNVNGTFDSGEGVCTTVANGATNATLVWPLATFNGTAGTTPTYARFRITTDALTGSSPGGPASNGEVEDYLVNFPPVCVSKVVPPTGLGWAATASATGSGAAAQIIDASFATTGWVSTTPAAGSFVTLDYGTAINLTGFVYYPRPYAAAQDINAYTVAYSNNGTIFTTIQSGNLPQQSYNATDGTGRPAIVPFSGTFNARYLRLTVNSTYQGGAAGIAELLPIVCQPPSDPDITCANANLLNTGTNTTGAGQSATNIFDRGWEVATVSNNTAANYASISNAIFLPAIVIGNIVPTAWNNSPFSNAEWIGYTPTGLDAHYVAGGANDYFYRYKITITDPYQLSGFKLKMNFMADNEVENVYINGVGQAPQTGLPQSSNNYVYGGFQLANQAQTILRNNWHLGTNEIIVHIKSNPGFAGFLGQNITSCNGLDFGDLPTSYNVTRAQNGPGHIVETNTSSTVTLKMGANADAEADGIASLNSNTDDITGTADEDGVITPLITANYCTVLNYAVTVNVTNTTGTTANLVGWIDWNGNGTFEASEGVDTTISSGASAVNTSLIWPVANITVPDTTTSLYARFRLSSDPLTTGTPNGVASDGEVEDYVIPLTWIDYDFGNLSTLNWAPALAMMQNSNSAWLGIDPANKECATNTLDSADGFSITDALSGSGTSNIPWELAGSGSTYTCQVTVNGSGAPKPVYWAVWFDMNSNGLFTDSMDIFQTGNLVHGSPVSTTFPITVPFGNGATSGAIRVAAAAVDPSYTKAMNGVGTFSNGEVEDYYITYTTPLPLHLTSFNAEKSGKDGQLTWTTVQEQSTAHFDIEHSADGKTFSTIGKVNAAGNSNIPMSYSFIHRQPGNGSHYYRLKMVDQDGKYGYSDIRVLNFGNSSQVLLYPNPVTQEATVTGLEIGDEVCIVSIDGRIELKHKAKSSTEKISMHQLRSGLHFVQVIREGGVLTVIKITKE